MILRQGQFVLNQINKFHFILPARAYNLRPRFHSGKACHPTKWEPIYKFPSIRFVAVLNKLKLYQLAISAAGIPLTFTLEFASKIPEGTALLFSAIGLTGFAALVLCSLFTRNVVGFIYTNSLGDKVKLSYVDFWGSRKDVEVAINEITSAPAALRTLDFYHNIQAGVGDKSIYKLLHRHGQVLNPERFTSIIGE